MNRQQNLHLHKMNISSLFRYFSPPSLLITSFSVSISCSRLVSSWNIHRHFFSTSEFSHLVTNSRLCLCKLLSEMRRRLNIFFSISTVIHTHNESYPDSKWFKCMNKILYFVAKFFSLVIHVALWILYFEICVTISMWFGMLVCDCEWGRGGGREVDSTLILMITIWHIEI